jgi:hypothetical protein
MSGGGLFEAAYRFHSRIDFNPRDRAKSASFCEWTVGRGRSRVTSVLRELANRRRRWRHKACSLKVRSRLLHHRFWPIKCRGGATAMIRFFEVRA